MRILWASNGPNVPSGYGVPTKYLAPFLTEMGHDLAIQAFYGIQGGMVNYRGIPVYPMQGEPYGADVIGHHARHFKADLVVTLVDNWVLPGDYGMRFDAKWMAWFPVDGTPAPKVCIAQALNCDYPATFSLNGVEELHNAGVDAYYIPYGVDCSVFKPGDKQEARAQLGLPQDVFLISTVADNRGFPARKAWPEILMGYKLFCEDHSDTLLYLHTRKDPISRQGINFDPLVEDLELDGKVLFTDPQQIAMGIPNEDLAPLYQASDVMLLPSMAEGFGLPVVEAQACGCPVITQDCSSMSELTFNGVALKPLQPFWAVGLNYWWQLPSIHDIQGALEFYYRVTGSDAERGCALDGVRHVQDNYDYPVVFEKYWRPLLHRIEEELW